MSLSLLNVATCLRTHYSVKVIDLNFYNPYLYLSEQAFTDIKFFGLKVSSQSYNHAIQVTNLLRQRYGVPIIWGGELPTLLPDECLKHADTIVSGLFEHVAEQLVMDLEADTLQKQYLGENKFPLDQIPIPFFDLIEERRKYYSFMGLPMETSRGCTEICTFCMVHVMQKKNYFTRPNEALASLCQKYSGHFVNVIDYNFGVDKVHVMQTSEALKQAGVTGWMAEMCIELLDDEELLKSLKSSGCRMIYCGLETIDEAALASVHKMNTNHVSSYARIIRKAQSYGIQIAAGIILGIENTNENTFRNLYEYFTRLGIVYAKLTYLTYNPGSKSQYYMRKKGVFTTDDIAMFDGNHLTFLPTGVNPMVVYQGANWFIDNYYSVSSIIHRSFNTQLTFARRIEFIMFNLCYRDTYLKWKRNDVFYHEEGFQKLLIQPFTKSFSIKFYEFILRLCRKVNPV